MRQTFPLLVAGREPLRVLEGIKHVLRKYLKRERRKRLPLAVDYWDFDCRIGPDATACRTVHVGELTTAVDVAVQENWPALYVEILAKPGIRTRRTEAPQTAD